MQPQPQKKEKKKKKRGEGERRGKKRERKLFLHERIYAYTMPVFQDRVTINSTFISTH